jgi:hypothetical protein
LNIALEILNIILKACSGTKNTSVVRWSGHDNQTQLLQVDKPESLDINSQSAIPAV